MPPPTRPGPPARGIRYVLSEQAVARLRAADRLLGDLRRRLYEIAPAHIVNDISESYLAVHEANLELDKCCIENAPPAQPPAEEEGD